MEYRNILYSVADGIARITLNRPERLNAFNVAMHEELRRALEQVERAAAERSVRVVVLTGTGRAFCAGQDLDDRLVAPGAAAPDLGASIEQFYGPLVLTLRRLSVPVLCVVKGVAAGAGANLPLACDIVIAARSATFIQAFCNLGLIPDTGGTYFLPRLLGPARATALALLGDKVPAEQAAGWGLIWKCVDDAQLGAEADALARRLAAAATLGVIRTRQALQASGLNTLEAQLEVERDFMRELGRTSDYCEGVAAFTEKRRPRFTGA